MLYSQQRPSNQNRGFKNEAEYKHQKQKTNKTTTKTKPKQKNLKQLFTNNSSL